MRLVQEIYTVTRQLPHEERFVICPQMRRSALSIPSNIAEGYSRRSRREYIRYLQIASASCHELLTQVAIARELYPAIDFQITERKADEIRKLLTVLIARLKHPQHLP